MSGDLDAAHAAALDALDRYEVSLLLTRCMLLDPRLAAWVQDFDWRTVHRAHLRLIDDHLDRPGVALTAPDGLPYHQPAETWIREHLMDALSTLPGWPPC